jgi:hypothetical protein
MNNNKALSDLYPFLNENKKGVNTELLLASIQEKVADSINAKQAFFQKNKTSFFLAKQSNCRKKICALPTSFATAVIVAISAVRLVKLRAFLPVVTGCINSVVICAASQDEPPFPMANKCPFC